MRRPAHQRIDILVVINFVRDSSARNKYEHEQVYRTQNIRHSNVREEEYDRRKNNFNDLKISCNGESRYVTEREYGDTTTVHIRNSKQESRGVKRRYEYDKPLLDSGKSDKIVCKNVLPCDIDLHKSNTSGIKKHFRDKDDPSRPPMTAKQVYQRQKQIDIGKNTPEYINYVKNVARVERTDLHPKTPPPELKRSTRSWQGMLRVWRRKLHYWDPVEPAKGTKEEKLDDGSQDYKCSIKSEETEQIDLFTAAIKQEELDPEFNDEYTTLSVFDIDESVLMPPNCKKVKVDKSEDEPINHDNYEFCFSLPNEDSVEDKYGILNELEIKKEPEFEDY